jgi:hypothetical protein
MWGMTFFVDDGLLTGCVDDVLWVDCLMDIEMILCGWMADDGE